MESRKRIGTSIISVIVLAIGIGVLWYTSRLPIPTAYAKIGPRVFPYVVGAILTIMGGLLLRSALARRWECEASDPDEPLPDLVPLAWVGGGLIMNMLLIQTIGFILSSTVMYVMVARGFGAKRLWFAAIVGFLLALVAYFGFAQLLGLRMGDGLIEDLI